MSFVEDFEKENPDLPQLLGSAKQVDWAREIRASAHGHINAAIARAMNCKDDAPDLGVRQRFVRLALECLENADATWWINRRQFLGAGAPFRRYVHAMARARRQQELQRAGDTELVRKWAGSEASQQSFIGAGVS